MTARVKDLLAHKGRDVITIRPDATVYEAIEKMVDANVGSIVVVHPSDSTNDAPLRLAGIFTERDYLRRIALEGRTSRTTRLDEVMTGDVFVVSPLSSVTECMSLMTEAKCRHLPVVDDGRLVGIVSIGDCVREVSRAAQAEVAHLQSYIQSFVMGRYPA
jgi:CBS domain-containing protein